MEKSLLIVESPTKVRTIKKYLGPEFDVRASLGHVKDLPPNLLGVDVEHEFKPEFQIISGKNKVLKDLRQAAQKAKHIYLAPDPDREGEAIAWHIAEELADPKKEFHRVLFHELSQRAIQEALRIRNRSMRTGSNPSWPAGFWTVWWGIRFPPCSGRKSNGGSAPAGSNRWPCV